MRNKKGFTLIEMLVVIAIIAILVAIIVPVATAATNKAACAANAANMRSVAGEVGVAMVSQNVDTCTVDNDAKTVTVGSGSTATTINLPTMKDCKVGSTEYAATATWAITVTNGAVNVTWGGATIDTIAGGAK